MKKLIFLFAMSACSFAHAWSSIVYKGEGQKVVIGYDVKEDQSIHIFESNISVNGDEYEFDDDVRVEGKLFGPMRITGKQGFVILEIPANSDRGNFTPDFQKEDPWMGSGSTAIFGELTINGKKMKSLLEIDRVGRWD